VTRAPAPVLAALLLLGCAAAPLDESQARVEYAFYGERSYPDFRLRRIVEDALLEFERDPTREHVMFDAAADLQDFYVSEGFPDAVVGYRIERTPKLRVVFGVEEGPRVTVAKLSLLGVSAIPIDDVLALWRRTRSGILGRGDPYFVLDDLRAFGVAVRELYFTRGYAAAAVTGPEVSRTPGGTEAEVSFRIDEGPLYTCTAVEVADELRVPEYTLRTDDVVGRPFDPDALQALQRLLRESLQNRGWADPVVRLTVDVDHASRTVQARLFGGVGERVRVGSITIAGNERTAASVIESAIAFASGEWYDASKVEATEQALYVTGLFTRVHVERVRSGPGVVDLTVRVEEIESLELSLLVGYGSYETGRAGVALTDRNLFGRGQRAQLGARASFKGYGLNASWTEPTLFGSETQLTITGALQEREMPSFTDFSQSLSAAFSRDLFEHVRGRTGYSLTNRDGRDVDRQGVLTDLEFDLSTVFGELVRDTRDSPLSPSVGDRESIKLEHASDVLGGSLRFDRLTLSAALFVPLAEAWILGLSARSGLAWPEPGEGLPIQERFFTGGESSVRSFREDQIGPRTQSGVAAGGEFFNVFNVELRFPLIKALHGAVFADAGNVGSRVEAYGLSNLRPAIGAGIRLELPIGPVRVDYGYNPDREPGERRDAFHVSVGLPF
jgi:outer membrane protein assembly complex protein YaeT